MSRATTRKELDCAEHAQDEATLLCLRGAAERHASEGCEGERSGDGATPRERDAVLLTWLIA
jgi:hypothetical protein